MKLPETPPKPMNSKSLDLTIYFDPDCQPILNKAQEEYYPWDKVKYIAIPKKYTHEEFWRTLKIKRNQNIQFIKIGQYLFSFCSTIYLQKEQHEFDMNFGSGIGNKDTFNDTDKQQTLVSSIMEEAIASSKIEGAVTTRKLAKEMLRQNRSPKNKSERMILNNYRTIQRIREIKDEPLTQELLLEVQRLMTADTLDDKTDEGRFRTDNSILVVDDTDGTVMHTPPAVEELEILMKDIYAFFNEDKDGQFIHPVLKACIIHFLIGFVHPFIDGNGRTARALFYWYMLKRGYWLTEYLSISGIILKTKVAYGKAFLNTEADDLDMTYFLTYKTGVIRQAYENLKKYLERKLEEKKSAELFMQQGGINERQAQILQWIKENASKIISVKEVETAFQVANETARRDLRGLVQRNLLESRKINKQKEVFVKGKEFEGKVRELKFAIVKNITR